MSQQGHQAPVRVDPINVLVIGVTLEFETMQLNKTSEFNTQPSEHPESVQMYLNYQFATFSEEELQPFVLERILLDPPATDEGDVYKRTGTGFSGFQRAAAARLPALPDARVLELQPFVMLMETGAWIRLDSHYRKTFE